MERRETIPSIHPEINQIAAEVGELVTLATREGEAVVLYRAREKAVEIDTHVGSRVTVHNSALGKTVLTPLPQERVEEIIEVRGFLAITPNTIADEAELGDELDWIREEGYVFDAEEQWRGLRCVDALILTDDGVGKGTVSLSAPESRLEDSGAREEYINQVNNTATILELRIPYSRL